MAVVSVRAALVDVPSVARHIFLALEGFVADVAGEKALVAVHVPLVDLQVAAVGERLLADITAKCSVRLNPVTDLQVFQVALLVVEGTAAVLTCVFGDFFFDFLLTFICLHFLIR